MEAASLTFPARRTSLLASYRERRKARRVLRMLADADRFDRTATRLEQQLEPDCWQVAHLRRSAMELRELAVSEQSFPA